MVATAGFCFCRLSPELWASTSMAGRLPPTSQRAFSAPISVGLKPLSSLRVGNSSTSHSSRRGLAEEQRVAFTLGAMARRRTYHTEGGGGGGYSSLQRRRPTSTAVQAYEQDGQQQQQQQQQQQEKAELPRPPLIHWERDLANAVQLIGRVGRDIAVKYLDSGKVVAHTSLAVKRGVNKSDETSWFELEIWDALAEIAAHHVEKGEQIFVTGRILVEKRVKDEITYTNVKVVVRDLCFVEPYNDQRQPYVADRAANIAPSQRSWTPQQSASQPSSGQKGSSSDAALATEKKWQEYFADPTQWWDNREKKKSPKAPDFRHKSTQEVLWIDGWNNPPWAAQQLAVLDEKKAQHTGDFDESPNGSQSKKLSSFKDSDFLY